MLFFSRTNTIMGVAIVGAMAVRRYEFSYRQRRPASAIMGVAPVDRRKDGFHEMMELNIKCA
jgi:hypothetical protein